MSSQKKNNGSRSWFIPLMVAVLVLVAVLLAVLLVLNRDELVGGDAGASTSSGQSQGSSGEQGSGPSSGQNNNTADNAGTSQQKPPASGTTTPEIPALEAVGLVCNGYSVYSGQYVEDGSDEQVTDVAAILITNRSGKFLDMATLTYDIDGEEAVFVVTGLPDGRSAWVMECSRKTAKKDSVFTFVDVVPGFREDAVASIDGLDISSGIGLLTVTNNTEETMEDVFILYKLVHKDKNFLGGITYRVEIGTLEPGDSVEKVLSHYSQDAEIVRIVQQSE